MRTRDNDKPAKHNINALTSQPDNVDCAIFLPSFHMGGVERVLINLALGISGSGKSVDVVVCDNKGEYKDDLAGLNVVSLNSPRAIYSVLPLAKYLRRKKPKYLISGKEYTSLVALWSKKLSRSNTKIIATIHVLMQSNEPECNSIRDKLVPFLLRIFAKNAHALVAVSKAAAAGLSNTCKIPLEQIHVIHNPVITDEYCIIRDTPIPDKVIADGKGPTVLAAGRLSYVKGFDKLIQAFSDVPIELNARLIILGDGPDREQLAALIEKYGLNDRVEMPGFSNLVPAYMKHSSLFVLSSHWECLPTVVIEAIGANCPVVAFDCPGGLREITNENDMVTFVPLHDIAALTTAITNALRNQKRVADDIDLNEFTYKTAVEKYLNLMPDINKTH